MVSILTVDEVEVVEVILSFPDGMQGVTHHRNVRVSERPGKTTACGVERWHANARSRSNVCGYNGERFDFHSSVVTQDHTAEVAEAGLKAGTAARCVDGFEAGATCIYVGFHGCVLLFEWGLYTPTLLAVVQLRGRHRVHRASSSLGRRSQKQTVPCAPANPSACPALYDRSLGEKREGKQIDTDVPPGR